MKKAKQILSKIELIHIAIILFLMLTLIFVIYQNTSCALKKIEISENVETENLPETDHAIEDINTNKRVKKLVCAIDVDKLPEKEYYNYVTGKGTGRTVNCSILLKTDGNYYKVKTLQEETQEGENQKGEIKAGKINLIGCVKNEYIKENSELLLYDEEKQKIYIYTGGSSETNS